MRFIVMALLCAVYLPGQSLSKASQSEGQNPRLLAQAVATGSDSEVKKAAETGTQEHAAVSMEKLATYAEGMGNYTLVLAGVTALLVLVGVIQFVAMIRQYGVLEEFGIVIGDSVELMRKAVATYEKTAGMGEQSIALTRESTTLTRQALVLTHRPRLIVRSLYTKGGLDAFQDGKTISGYFSVVNVGASKAHLTKLHAAALVAKRLPMKAAVDGPASAAIDKHLAPGEPLVGSFTATGGALKKDQLSGILTVASGGNSAAPPDRFYVLGFVEYTDGLEPPTLRRTEFCRVFNSASGRFEAIEDPDYEHAD